MWCCPAVGTAQPTHAAPACAPAASRKAFSSPEDALRRSSRALASRAGWAKTAPEAASRIPAHDRRRTERLTAQSSRERSDRIETGPLTVESRTTGDPESPNSTVRESSVQFFRASSQAFARHWKGERPELSTRTAEA